MTRRTDVSAAADGVGGGALCFAQVADLPVVLDVPSAGRLLGIGRTRAYRLVNSGGFPCRVIRIGGTWRVPTADLLALLGVPTIPEPAASGRAELSGSDAPPVSGAADRRVVVRPVVRLRWVR